MLTKISHSKNILLVIAFLGCFIIWEVSSAYIFNPFLVPSPRVVAVTLWNLVESGEIFLHIWVSLRRVVMGYFWGNLIGIIIGLLMGRILAVRGLLEPAIAFFRSISPVALVPVAIIWFGIGETSKHFVILYASVIVIIYNTMAGVMATPEIRIRAAQCLGASQWRLFSSVILPSAWPYILTGMRIALGWCFMGVIAAEMIASEQGLGYLIMQATQLILVEQMFAGLICLGILGALAERTLLFIVRHTMRRYMLDTETE